MPVTRRQILRFGLTGLAGMAISSPVVAQAPAPAFTLVLVNDIDTISESGGRGGFARLAAVVKAERARGVPVLFAHAGDMLSPSLLSSLDQGEHIIALLNRLSPDVVVPGNHEFDFGKDVFLRRMAEATFPVFAANLRDAAGKPLPGLRDRSLIERGGVRIGLVGLALAATPTVSSPGDLVFADEMETLKREVAALRAEGAEFIIAVGHTDRDVDMAIFNSGLVDVLLTGHNHDLFLDYDGRALVLESSQEAQFVSAIDVFITISGEGSARRLTWRPQPRLIDTAGVTPDPDMASAVAALEKQLSTEFDVAIGRTTVELDSRSASVRRQETAMGNLVADAVRASTGAEIALFNGGGIRANRLYAPGSALTRKDILAELPFGNRTALVEVTGAQLRAALENGVSQIENGGGRFPQVSGLAFTYDPKAPAGSRIVSVTVAGVPLDPARRYRLGVNDFMLRGGDGYTGLSQGKVLLDGRDGKLLANEVMAYVRRLGTITTGVDGRIRAQ